MANLNFFMNVPVEPDGGMALVEGFSAPGDFVDLRAEMDVLAVSSRFDYLPDFYSVFEGQQLQSTFEIVKLR